MKLIEALEHRPVEFGELQKHRAEFVTQQVHPLDEFIELPLTVRQDFLMGDDLWDLNREDEIAGSLFVPARDRRRAWGALKRAIDLNGLKLAGIMAEEILGPQACRIKGAFPT